MAADKHFTVAQSESLQQLRDAIDMDRGYFSLIFAHCHYRFLRDRLIADLLETPDLQIEAIELLPETKSLLKALEQYFQGRQQSDLPDGILIRGFERVENLAALLTSINQVRESLKRGFPMPMVFWITPDVLKEINNSAPDLESWAIGVEFQADVQDLAHYIESIHTEFLAQLTAGNFITSTFFPVEMKALEVELEKALQDFSGEFSSREKALIQTILGVIYSKTSRSHLAIDTYKKVLAIYQELSDLEAQGIIYNQLVEAYYFRGFSDHQYVSYISSEAFDRLIENQKQPDSSWQQAYFYIQKTIDTWRMCKAEHNIAWGLLFWQNTLRYLEYWAELEDYSRQVLTLLEVESQQYFRVMHYLAKALKAQGKIGEAKECLERLIADVKKDYYIYPLSLRNLAQIYQQEGRLQEALQLLIDAKQDYDVPSMSRFYVMILEQQRDILFGLGRYLEAYRVKEEKQLAEYEYSFKSFIGATRIQPRRDEVGMSSAIRASGRGKDVEKLVDWITGNEHAVTVIYGYSGVGKSSLVNAGLIPELAKSQRSAPNGYVQVVFRSYSDWQQNLLDDLQANVSFGKEDPPQPPLSKGGEEINTPIASLSKGGGEAGGIQNVTQPTENPPQPPFERGRAVSF